MSSFGAKLTFKAPQRLNVLPTLIARADKVIK
jgi:hypothetical protein